MNTTNDNSRPDLARLAMEIALAVSYLHPDYQHDGFDKRLHQIIIASLNEQGTPEPNSGIPLVLPRILELVRDGSMDVHHIENDAPPSDLAEVEAEPWDWYVTPADADVILRAMGLGPLVDKLVERRNKEAAELAARRNAGIVSLDDVATELAQLSPIAIPRWRELLVIAVSDRKIPLRNPINFADPSDFPVPEQVHAFAAQARLHPRDRQRGYNAGDTCHPATMHEVTAVAPVNRWLASQSEFSMYLLDEPDARSAGAVAPDGGYQKRALTKAELIASDWPLLKRLDLDKALSDVPAWLKHARVTIGKAGNIPSTWNPAMVGMCLVATRRANKVRIGNFIDQHFPDWSAEWDSLSETL